MFIKKEKKQSVSSFGATEKKHALVPVKTIWFFFILVHLVYGCEEKQSAPLLSNSQDKQHISKSLSMENATELKKRKINFVFKKNRETPNPPEWDAYDGSPYTKERGYGWLSDMAGKGKDRGRDASVLLPRGKESTPGKLERLELSNWQGRADFFPLVFRIDLEDGWYKVTCSSVDPGAGPLPVVDKRSFKCRSHNIIFAGSKYGSSLMVGGSELVEGADVVEVIDGHLRIVVGDPTYGGWVWKHEGPWYRGWVRWIANDHSYATGWYQKITRRVDPGFHMLRVNSLEIEKVRDIPTAFHLFFRDFFNRDDNQQSLNQSISEQDQWLRQAFYGGFPEEGSIDLYKTSIRIGTSRGKERTSSALLQRKMSPDKGVVRYAMRGSLFTGAGSKKQSGRQEAGMLLLVDPERRTPFASTFVGVGYDEKGGHILYRVGDGGQGFSTEIKISDQTLPFVIKEGEFGIVVIHDVDQGAVKSIQINGVELVDRISESDRQQRLSSGEFGIGSVMNNVGSGVELQQFYWFYQVDYL